MADPSVVRFRAVVAAACGALESRVQEVNDLNVFPVADGDTGDNMAMTLRAVLDELDRINELPIDDIGREQIVRAVARAALLGARGNSGVILSQIVRGAAEELVSRNGELVDPVLVAAAFARAADAAYESVREPAEGTMLTAVRAMAHRVARELAQMERPRLDPGATPAEQDEVLAEVLARALEAGDEAVRRGPEQLDVLREAGVVDAGAYGLTVIVAGVVAALRGEEAPMLAHQATPAARPHSPHHESTRYRYCTTFAVTGSDLEGSLFVPRLEALGDSVLVVGDRATLKVHVHTDHPDRATALFAGAGEVSRLEVGDMREQAARRTERLASREVTGAPACGAVTVASGAGVLQLFRDLGAVSVDGGTTMNPSTREILAGIEATGADEVVVLANSRNVELAAEGAAALADRPVEVVRTHSQQAGLAALVAFDPLRSARENARAVAAAADKLGTGGVAVAARDDVQGRFRAGDAVGYSGDELVAWGDPRATLEAVVKRVTEGRELLTCLAGDGAPAPRSVVEEVLPGGVELDFHEGGQPAWWWLLCAE